MFKLTRKKPTAGFTLIEVMAAILILSFFLAVTMQAMVIAAMFKVKAKRYAEATAWIQQDIERIRNTGSTLGMDMKLMLPVTNNSAKDIFIEEGTGALTKTIPSKIVIGDASKTFTVTDIIPTLSKTDPSTGQPISVSQITLDSPIGKTFSSVTPAVKVVEVTKCSATVSTAGLGQELIYNLPSLPPNPISGQPATERTIAGQTYQINRTLSPKNAIPYNILEVSYTVTPKGKNTPVIAENFSEVIPDASLYCPQ